MTEETRRFVRPLTFHIEHVIAKQHLGSDDDSNLALACDKCNLHKGTNLTTINQRTGEVVELYNPRTDNWAEHFAMEGPDIVGLTDIGIESARLLQMNSTQRIALRRRLIKLGAMP